MSQSRLIVLYDDHCSFCRAQMRVLKRLDWLDRLEMRPASAPGEEVAALGVVPEALAEAIHCITPKHRVFRAAKALRVIGARVPLLFPLTLLLWLPGSLRLAESAYRWVARHRYRLGGQPCGNHSGALKGRNSRDTRSGDQPPGGA
jgi:predicted DCC family thiol-disulfide oxidoreductase YuxK